MDSRTPRYVLYSQANLRHEPGRWKVSLKATDGSACFEAEDDEPEARGERLELLAVVRGLEALDQPSLVTLVTASRYVRRGLAYGLADWRANGWAWEWYGQMVPVKNVDLWQRLDRALEFHVVELRRYRFDSPHEAEGPHVPREAPGVSAGLAGSSASHNRKPRGAAPARLPRPDGAATTASIDRNEPMTPSARNKWRRAPLPSAKSRSADRLAS